MSGCEGRNTLAATWLGNVRLSPHAVLRGLEQPSLTWEDKRTLGGRLVYRRAVAIKGRSLILDLLEGHTTVGELRQVRALIDAGAPVTLEHHTWTGTVRVDAIQGVNLPIDYADAKDDDWASAEIRLTEL